MTSFRLGVGIFSVLLLASLAAWIGRVQVLEAAARAWVLCDSISEADAIVVLGGGMDTRPFSAADLYKKGLAKQIVVSKVRPGSAEKLKIVAPHTEANRAVLLELGVPPDAIVNFGNDLSNTYEEAHALAKWAETNGIRSIIVPTESFSSRRVRWILERELNRIGVRVEVLALPTLDYNVNNWWRDEQGVIGFQNEVIKYLYYRMKY
jgi:uncharacterized SAM-binding protein YcdF (DUF218 family)